MTGESGDIPPSSAPAPAPFRVLAVCTGNICRSPALELLIAAQGIPGVIAESAGTGALVGDPVHPPMARLLEADSIDTSAFRARHLTPAIVESADLILTATADHKALVLREVPRALRRTFTVLELAELVSIAPEEVLTHPSPTLRVAEAARLRSLRRGETDVPDPYQRSAAAYAAAYETLKTAVSSHLADLLRPE